MIDEIIQMAMKGEVLKSQTAITNRSRDIMETGFFEVVGNKLVEIIFYTQY